jgi:hypothetical protein
MDEFCFEILKEGGFLGILLLVLLGGWKVAKNFWSRTSEHMEKLEIATSAQLDELRKMNVSLEARGQEQESLSRALWHASEVANGFADALIEPGEKRDIIKRTLRKVRNSLAGFEEEP